MFHPYNAENSALYGLCQCKANSSGEAALWLTNGCGQDIGKGMEVWNGLHQCILGRRADLRPYTDFNGKNKTDARQDYGAVSLFGGGNQCVWDLRAFSAICGGRRFRAFAGLWQCFDERRKESGR